jgi:hypothetical protein
MPNPPSLGSLRPFTITDAGRAAASATASCVCRWQANGPLLICALCGFAIALYRPGNQQGPRKYD